MLLSKPHLAALCLSTVVLPFSAMSATSTKQATVSVDDPAYMVGC